MITEADKGGCLVIIDSDFYRNKLVLEDHLMNTNTYKKVDSYQDEITMKNVNDLIEKHENCFTKMKLNIWRTMNGRQVNFI